MSLADWCSGAKVAANERSVIDAGFQERFSVRRLSSGECWRLSPKELEKWWLE